MPADKLTKPLSQQSFIINVILLKRFRQIEAASDVSFADNSDKRSTEDYIFKLFEESVDWKSKKQRITTSTIEAELLAISQTGKESI
ncbi:predicted protein [Histoplasma mississippiense (nom. inval.)]|uniref:predicted protein n=1 Tax=Ajellomyces capsulatus (strain NAm1 / WU24) TaxID=2059318 RepID=UPI000157C4BF|nr:predicted protein [Histoplasma mississippiense (nom. inval.)]EDN08506.1 predicted protein [Histoplasma mississippiense (nom. inval.)]